MFEFLVSCALAGILIDHPSTTSSEITITVTNSADIPLSGVSVRAHHRPGWHDASEIAVGISDSNGRVRWAPKVSGPALLQAGTQTQTIYIKTDATNTPTKFAFLSLVGIANILSLPKRHTH